LGKNVGPLGSSPLLASGNRHVGQAQRQHIPGFTNFYSDSPLLNIEEWRSVFLSHVVATLESWAD
jgi:hypothetical protein